VNARSLALAHLAILAVRPRRLRAVRRSRVIRRHDGRRRERTPRPSSWRTPHVACGAPHEQDTAVTHREPLDVDEIPAAVEATSPAVRLSSTSDPESEKISRRTILRPELGTRLLNALAYCWKWCAPRRSIAVVRSLSRASSTPTGDSHSERQLRSCCSTRPGPHPTVPKGNL